MDQYLLAVFQLSLGVYWVLDSGAWLYYTCLTLWLGKRIELIPYRGETQAFSTRRGGTRYEHYLYFRSEHFITQNDSSQELILDALRPNTYFYAEVAFQSFPLAYREFGRDKVYLVETYETVGQLLTRVVATAYPAFFGIALAASGLRLLLWL